MNVVHESDNNSSNTLVRRPARNLLMWVVVASLCFSFLPSALWRQARWILAALLIVEVGRLAARKLNSAS